MGRLSPPEGTAQTLPEPLAGSLLAALRVGGRLMRPSEVRERVLADHEVLRQSLDDLERRAQAAIGGGEDRAPELRADAERFLATLQRHMRWEDRFLAPALREADAWGVERAARLDAEHREQRELLHHVLEGLRDLTRPGPVVAANLLDLVRLLREDMDDEEEALVNPRVLRDDVISLGEPE
jgi:hemerythrin-like domain-containing protein